MVSMGKVIRGAAYVLELHPNYCGTQLHLNGRRPNLCVSEGTGTFVFLTRRFSRPGSQGNDIVSLETLTRNADLLRPALKTSMESMQVRHFLTC